VKKPKTISLPSWAYDALIRAGAMCSNCCYNLAQKSEPLSERSKESMREAYKAWDKASQDAGFSRKVK